MKKITQKQFEKACEIVERYNYQENPETFVSATYVAKISVDMKIPSSLDLKETINILKDGYSGFDNSRHIGSRTEIVCLEELIIDGNEIDLKSKIKTNDKRRHNKNS